MKSNESTPAWVQPVDAATCAALSRELWGMLSAAGVDLSVVEFCDYITGATLAFQRAYIDAEWGVTHDWMEATEQHLAGYLRDYPIRPLEAAWERHGGPLPSAPLPVTSPVYATNLDDAAIRYAEKCDTVCDSVGRGLAEALRAAGIPCVHYGDGDLVVLWGVSSRELRIHLYVTDDLEPTPDNVFAEVLIVTPDADEEYDVVAEGLTNTAAVAVVRGLIAQVHDE